MIATFECCSLILKQILFEKMFSCKLAIPVITPTDASRYEVSLWSMRTITIEGMQHGELVKDAATDMPCHTIMVARMGELLNSKSWILNVTVSNLNLICFEVT